MHNVLKSIAAFTLLAIVGVLGTAATANADSLFAVTVTNLTRKQVMTFPLVTSHNRSVTLFTPGEKASPQLAALAEDGNTMPLEMLLAGKRGVYDVNVGSDLVMPGKSLTVEVRARGSRKFLSGVSMLATSNDAFWGFRSVPAPFKGRTSFMVPAYDAGSEANSELCAFIPGPPCGNDGVHDPSTPEGFIHIHNGIYGIGDLSEPNMNWHNPVAMVTIERIR